MPATIIRQSSVRRGFTLIELMVSMALTLFVMLILTQAFTTSLETFSQLKSLGEMQADLRTISSLLQADLASDHFEGDRRLSSPDILTNPPLRGFFYVYQGSLPTVSLVNYNGNVPVGYMNEGVESGFTTPGLLSYRANNHMLYFTVRKRGNRPEDYFTTGINPDPANLTNSLAPPNFFGQSTSAMGQLSGFFSSQWAEVCYFLVQTGSTMEPGNASSSLGTPLFALYRGEYLLASDPSTANSLMVPKAQKSNYPNVSCFPNAGGTLTFNSPDDVVNPVVRTLNANSVNAMRNPHNIVKVAPPTTGQLPTGVTLVLSNVTSFQVQIFAQQLGAGYAAANDFGDLPNLAANSPGTFDTSPAPPYLLQAIKVSVRVWDARSQMSRQVTVIQDM